MSDMIMFTHNDSGPDTGDGVLASVRGGKGFGGL